MFSTHDLRVGPWTPTKLLNLVNLHRVTSRRPISPPAGASICKKSRRLLFVPFETMLAIAWTLDGMSFRCRAARKDGHWGVD